MTQQTTVLDLFRRCVDAIRNEKFIHRETRQDKEFHFQNWVRGRLEEIVGYKFDLRANVLSPETIPNPSVGRDHEFRAWRVSTGSRQEVVLQTGLTVEREAAKDHGDG